MLFSIAACVAAIILFNTACQKNNASPSIQSQKTQLVSGNWQETDIQLDVAASVKVGSTKYSFPVGTSMITNPTLKTLGVTALFAPTINNVYHFSDSGAYSIDGVTKLILPVAGNMGKWSLDEYGSILKLDPSDTVNDPHWITAYSDTTLSLLMTVTIPGLGAAPLTLQLKKQ